MSDSTGFQGVIKTSYLDSTPSWPEKKKAPADAPNIIYIVLDDTGYSQLGCFGSLVETPHIDSLAADGLRYRDFHVNAMCSPTRGSLLTGCNNHTVGLGFLANFDLGFPRCPANLIANTGISAKHYSTAATRHLPSGNGICAITKRLMAPDHSVNGRWAGDSRSIMDSLAQ